MTSSVIFLQGILYIEGFQNYYWHFIMTSRRSLIWPKWPLRGQISKCHFLLHGCFYSEIFWSRISKTTLALGYDLSEVTYIKVFWINIEKKNYLCSMTFWRSLIWPHWPLGGQNFKVSFLASWLSLLKRFLGEGFWN